MKKYLLLIVLFSISSIIDAQSWNYNTSGNDFDGKYKIALTTGNGNNYPYSKPSLVINYFEKDDSFNFYINGAGYYSDSYDVEILWVFDNEKDVIYESRNSTLSENGKTIFFYEFYSPKSDEIISVYEFINKLKVASSVSVRVSGKYDKNDVKFSLSGSTKAINHVITVEEIDLKINTIKIAREISNEKERKKDSLINLFETIKKKERNDFNKQQRNIDSISKTIYTITNKLSKLSSFPSLTIKSLNRENMIREKVKFLIKKYKQDYQNFERADNFPYRSFLKYDDFKGRIATIIDLVKEDYFGVEYFIYKLELDDNKEIVYLKVSEYKNFNYQDIGFVSLLDKARNMYLGKTFWKEKIIDLVEYKISKITFAGDDGEVFRNGAFNVHLETKRYFNRSEGTVLFNSQKPKVINVNFSKMYSLVEKDNSNPKEKVFENIFYYLEE